MVNLVCTWDIISLNAYSSCRAKPDLSKILVTYIYELTTIFLD